jgi:insulin receptor
VCNGVDIRNDVSTFERLRGCRVIEGSVQIVLMDASEEKLSNFTFPELREITGYLLLFRVQGLRSLSRLFPNLAVIRGDTLFFNFALVIYEMKHLQEVGLNSLTHVIRGAVNIERNSLLCYVDTIDWGHIAKHGKELHVINVSIGHISLFPQKLALIYWCGGGHAAICHSISPLDKMTKKFPLSCH